MVVFGVHSTDSLLLKRFSLLIDDPTRRKNDTRSHAWRRTGVVILLLAKGHAKLFVLLLFIGV